ncbi:hypothetical protein GFY24_32300 [Nocardia sp. SYP-A9097]|uniref:DUF4440 domain-containing protein n=1 Tax=Nocardia sp. SYP-A9097 TaxID=2663237 RepID=UPI00129B5588|nr:DUF4440 domain-containing protein [Nocardia sp. SYP-A9097]MRH92067.1 hypothetical protein [Nocardia sp. SYP-A9097]
MGIDHDAVAGEVVVLHEDLAEWLGAGAAAALEAFIGQLAQGFSMVTMEGVIVEREGLVEGLRGAGNAEPGMSIEIADIEVQYSRADCAVVRFREVHRGGRSRLTTAVLVADSGGRNGVRWRSVHETASS